MQVPITEAELLNNAAVDGTMITYPKMNHVLKVVNSPTENQQSYRDPNFPMSDKLIQLITGFVKK